MQPSDYLESGLLSGAGFVHAFFTRRGGVSEGTFGALNVSPEVGDIAENVAENRRRGARVLGLDVDRLYMPRQVHGKAVIALDATRAASEIAATPADALIASEPLIGCGVRTADCVPILLADLTTRRVAAVHAGWRGVVDRILAAVVAQMAAQGSRPEALIAAIGPHISLAAFEVGEEVAVQLEAASRAEGAVVRSQGRKPHAALAAIVRSQLEELGLLPEHVEQVPGCTFEDSASFFSYRRDGHASGRMLSAIVSGTVGDGGRKRRTLARLTAEQQP